MPHIYKSKIHGWRVKYRVWFPDGNHTDKIKHRRKKADAERMFAEVDQLESHSRKASLSKKEITFYCNMKYLSPEEATLLAGAFISPYQTWRELAKRYEDWARTNCRAYTHNCNMSKLKLVLNAFEKIPLGELKREDMQDYISRRKKEVKADTICKELIVLRKLLDYFQPDDNPARKIPMPKLLDKRKKRPLSIIEMQTFFRQLEKNRSSIYGLLKEFVMLYLYAGMRPSEIIRLKPSDVRLDIQKIHVQGETKTGEDRSIDIHPELMSILKSLLKKAKGDYLFGKKLLGPSLSRAIRKTMRSAGLSGITPYSLRHSFISYLLKHTRDLAYVMKQAGHKNIKTTQGYIDVIEDPESPINKLDFGIKTTNPKNTPLP